VDSEFRKLDFFGIYKYDVKNESISLINKDYLPNGIALSNDEKFLYFNKMGVLDEDPKILKIDLNSLKTEVVFEGKKLSEKWGNLYDITSEKNTGNFDGMKIHSSGNIFTSGPGGILVISPEGSLLSRIKFGHTTNCAFDTNENYLYVTGFADNPKVYRIKLKS
jgi:gluconolactonase